MHMRSLYDLFPDWTEAPFSCLVAASYIVDELAGSTVCDDEIEELKRRLDNVLEELQSHTQEPELVLMLFHLHSYAEIFADGKTSEAVLRVPLAYVASLISDAMAEVCGVLRIQHEDAAYLNIPALTAES